jgi:hypothetical protein
VGKPEAKRQLGRPTHRWRDNIKMDLQEVSSDNSRTTGFIVITFYTGSPCIRYVQNLNLCENQHKKKDVALCKIINMDL